MGTLSSDFVAMLRALSDAQVEFIDEAWPVRVSFALGGVPLCAPSARHLIQNKRASGRLKDLADVEALEQAAVGGD